MSSDTHHLDRTPWGAYPLNPSAGLPRCRYVVARPGRVGIAIEDRRTAEWLAERLNELYELRRRAAATPSPPAAATSRRGQGDSAGGSHAGEEEAGD